MSTQLQLRRIGIGLEVHEAPYLRGGSSDIIQTGHTFSDEPGVYMEGKVTKTSSLFSISTEISAGGCSPRGLFCRGTRRKSGLSYRGRGWGSPEPMGTIAPSKCPCEIHGRYIQIKE